MNIDKSIFSKKVLIALAECLILFIPLSFLMRFDGLKLVILALFFYLIFCKKIYLKPEIFFYSITFISGSILWVMASFLPLINGEPTISDIISSIFYALDLSSIYLSLSGIIDLLSLYILFAIPSISLFYLFALSSKNNKTNVDKLLVLLLTVFMLLSIAFVLLLDLTILTCVIELCSYTIPTVAGLYTGYYLIYRKLPSLHLLAWMPAFACLFTLLEIIILSFTLHTLDFSVAYTIYLDIAYFVIFFLISFSFAYIVGVIHKKSLVNTKMILI